MKAIVLTYDKQVGLAELVVKSYRQLWKGCPFQFVIPRNDDRSPHFDFLASQKNVTIVRTPSSIRGTMSVLLGGLDDDAWVYWCIDDRYPIEIDQRRAQMAFDFIASGAAEDLNAIKLIHWKETADASSKDINIGDRQFRFQSPSSTWGFWHHHFVRAKVLKQTFLELAPADIADSPTAMNRYLHGLPLIEVFKNVVFPVEGPIVQFGETLVQGVLLANAFEALSRYDCPVPDYRRHTGSVLFRTQSSWQGVAAVKGHIAGTLKESLPPVVQPPRSRLKNAFRLVRAWVQGA